MVHLMLAAAISLSPPQVDQILARAEAAFHAYVFPEIATRTVETLKQNTPRYERINDPQAFVSAVNADLYASTHDKHVRIDYPFRTEMLKHSTPSAAEAHHFEVAEDYFFRQVRRLPGNVGYLRFNGFSGDRDAGSIIQSAMNFISGTGALIIDLRQNGGGDPRAAQTLEAYFFSQQQQVTSLIMRDPETGKLSETQQYTAATVPGPLYLNKPVYLLTSNRTFSCAEQFVYDLHNLKRVTLVGQTTGGGANPGGFHDIGDEFAIFIPQGRAYSEVTKTNWEGTGIAPDISVPAKDALTRAYVLALKHVKAHERDSDVQDEIKQALANPAKALATPPF